jgi:hypothetical protein
VPVVLRHGGGRIGLGVNVEEQLIYFWFTFLVRELRFERSCR